MAVLRDYEVKALRVIEGREGYGFKANLYYKNKKVGSLGDYADGSGVDIELPKEEFERFMKIGEQFMKEYEHEFTSVDMFAHELVNMKEYEGDYKKAIKQGYGKIAYLRDDFRSDKPKKIPQMVKVPKNYQGDINPDGYDIVEQFESLEDFNKE